MNNMIDTTCAPVPPDTGPAALVSKHAKNMGRLARLKANGISDKSICVVCGISSDEWTALQATDEFQAKLEIAAAQTEVKPMETATGIATLEEQALKQTIYNVQQGYCDPSFVLDALKYATKVRLDEKKLEQEKQAAFTANTQIVINMNTLLQNALKDGGPSRTVTFEGDSKAVVNGLDTDTLYARAMGQSLPATKPGQYKKETLTLKAEDLDDVLFVSHDDEEEMSHD